MGPARNGSAVASRPSLRLSRTCHKGVAPPPPPPPLGGPGSWRKSVPQPGRAAPGSPWGRGVGGSLRAGDDREGGGQPPKSAAGRRDWGPGKLREEAWEDWRWADPEKEPGGSPLGRLLKVPEEVPGRGCFPFNGFLTRGGSWGSPF